MNNKGQESITITGGLGAINAIDNPIKLRIAPLTVFIGPQGTGKSLISQLLYFFHDAKYLLSHYFNQESPDATVRKVVEGIRAGELTNRALASFLTTTNVRVEHISHDTARKITFYKSNRKINPNAAFRKEIDIWFQQLLKDRSSSGNIFARALFVPAERTFYSRFTNADPAVLGSRALPITMREFSKALSISANISQAWQSKEKAMPREVEQIRDLVKADLGGQAIIAKRGRYARQWQWLPANSQQPLEIEMASSGQMGTWPLVVTMQALFGLPVHERPRFIHIEEPETHLHPAAQVAVVKMLAFLINQGFKIVVTTHSLEILYALNNLILADKQLADNDSVNNGFPSPQERLAAENVTAYLFANGGVQSIMSESGQIDEGILGTVLGDLEIEFNQLMTHNLWK